MEFIVEGSIAIDDQKVHKAKLVDIKTGTSDGYGEYLRFLFSLVDEPSHPLVSGICTAQLTVGNKLYSWLSVLNGSNLEIGTQIESEDYIGRVVELTVKNIQNDGRTFTNVDSLIKLVSDANINYQEVA